MKTVVYQSYRTTNVPEWIDACLDSVRAWATARGYDYRFVGDEILWRVPESLREAAGGRMPVITDVGRLLMAREFLGGEYGRAVWLDADVLVFDAAGLDIGPGGEGPGYAFGAEVWVQPGKGGGLKAHRNVHNAICVFEAGNPMIEFCIHACESVLGRVAGGGPPQIVGPKLLTALHSIVGFPLIDGVGMLSPLVLRDVVAGGGPALDLLREISGGSLRATNLCASLAGTTRDGVDVTDELLARVCTLLAETGGAVLRQDG